MCCQHQGKPYLLPQAPPLSAFQMKPFAHTGVDFVGPPYVCELVSSTPRKVWVCLYTCCVTRAVHLDIVPDMRAEAFIQCFRRFTARRGFPVRMVSDNGKTFNAAAKAIVATVKSSPISNYLSNLGIKWTFNRLGPKLIIHTISTYIT